VTRDALGDAAEVLETAVSMVSALAGATRAEQRICHTLVGAIGTTCVSLWQTDGPRLRRLAVSPRRSMPESVLRPASTTAARFASSRALSDERWLRALRLSAAVVVPVRVETPGDHLLLLGWSRNVEPPPGNVLAALGRLGRLAGTVLATAESARRVREAEAIGAVARELAAAADVDGMIASMLQILGRQLGARVGLGLSLADAPLLTESSWSVWHPRAKDEKAVARLRETAGASYAQRLLAESLTGRATGEVDSPAPGVVVVPLHHDGPLVAVLQFLLPPRRSLSAEGRRVAQEVARLAGPLIGHRSAEEELKRLESRNAEFVARAAHELRAPIAAMSTLAETVSLHLDDLPPDRLRWAIDSEANLAVRLRTLVRDVLDVSRLEASDDRPEVGSVRLADVIASARTLAPPPAGIRLELSLPPSVVAIANAPRLEQVVVNLLTNAYHYGGPHVRLRLADDGHTATIVVSDDGPGVPKACESRVFEPFVRGHADREGNGLGLSIAQRLTRSMGGRIEYRDGGGAGATFVVRLQADPAGLERYEEVASA
jgi:signal transduction histidine kinase